MEYVTINRRDRIGMNIYSRLVLLDFCNNNSSTHTYVHTPLRNPIVEDLFNLGDGYKKIEEMDNKIQVTQRPKREGSLQTYRNRVPRFSEQFRKDIIRRYTSTYSSDIKGINICIHVRRGDSLRYSQPCYENRWVSDEWVDAVLYKINKFKERRVEVTIHSDSILDMEKFETYNLKVNTKFRISVEEAMQDMISCDVLFRTGISAFSGVCALYNTNLVISDVPSEYKNLYEHDNVVGFAECDGRLQHILSKRGG